MHLTKPLGRPKIRVMEPTPTGVLLRETREAKRLTLGRLASACGKSVQTINAIELGESQNPQLNTVIPIFDALGLPRQRAYDLLSPPKEATPRQPPKNGRRPGKATAST